MGKFVHVVGEGARFPFEISKKKGVKNNGDYTYCTHRQGKPKIDRVVCKGCKILVCNQNPNNEGVKKMTKNDKKAITLETVMEKLVAIDERMKSVVENLEELKGVKVPAEQMPTEAVEQRMSRKMGKKEKDALKAELLKNGPYGKEGLEKLGTKKSRQYASALKLNCFGMSVDAVTKLILAEEAKLAKKDAGAKKEPEKKVVKKTAQKAKK